MYGKHLQMYFVVSDITNDAKKRAILLSVSGPTTYLLIHNPAQPKKPLDLSYAELVQLLCNHYFALKSLSVQRFRFNSCSRHPSETVTRCIAELCRLSEYCEFGESLDVNDERMQRRLLAEPEVAFKRKYAVGTSD